VDPAIGTGSQHDYFAACVVGLISAGADGGTGAQPVAGMNGGRGDRPTCQLSADEAVRPTECTFFVLDVLRQQSRFPDQLAALDALCRRWRPRLVAIESVAYQAALSQAAWDAGLPVVAQSEHRPKPVRIEAAAVHAAHGRLVLPLGAAWLPAFLTEAVEYPAGAHDDQLDALARALETGLALLRGGGEVLGADTQRGMPREAYGFAPVRGDWRRGF